MLLSCLEDLIREKIELKYRQSSFQMHLLKQKYPFIILINGLFVYLCPANLTKENLLLSLMEPYSLASLNFFLCSQWQTISQIWGGGQAYCFGSMTSPLL